MYSYTNVIDLITNINEWKLYFYGYVVQSFSVKFNVFLVLFCFLGDDAGLTRWDIGSHFWMASNVLSSSRRQRTYGTKLLEASRQKELLRTLLCAWRKWVCLSSMITKDSRWPTLGSLRKYWVWFNCVKLFKLSTTSLLINLIGQ